jgi:hypothetical protein
VNVRGLIGRAAGALAVLANASGLPSEVLMTARVDAALDERRAIVGYLRRLEVRSDSEDVRGLLHKVFNDLADEIEQGAHSLM